MAESLLTKLDRLHAVISKMAARERELTERNRALTEENEFLRLAASEADKARERAELDAHYLSVSHRLADNPDSIVETRRDIAKLIRNIDRCLEMLKE